jgi:septal ring factor EnvC (AmiA/AmiB activator)
MKRIFVAVLLLAGVCAFAQNHSATEELNEEVNLIKVELQRLKSESRRLRAETSSLQTQLKATHRTIDSLKLATQRNSKAIGETADQLGLKISTSEATANEQFQQVNRSVSNTVLYVIIVFLLTILLSGVVYWFLTKRQRTDKSDVIDQLDKAKTDIEGQLKKIEDIPVKIGEVVDDMKNLEAGDHILALKLAREINTMERNISLMNEDTKGLKQLKRSVEALKDNLAAKGYEVPKLLGKEFHEGMKVTIINTVLDEELEAGAEIITKVIIPQVNYNGKMIQAAQIEVTVGPEAEEVEAEEVIQ